MDKSCIVIPAVKKNVAFTDDLVKKLAGVPLIQRVIDKAKDIVSGPDIYVVTDSDEIRLICTRNDVRFYYDKELRLKEGELFSSMKFFVLKIAKKYKDIILLSPYAPLLPAEELSAAYDRFCVEKADFLQPVKRQSPRIFQKNNHRSLRQLVFDNPVEEIFIESQAFQIFRSELVFDGQSANDLLPVSYELSHAIEEINSFQDWWVCEKILNRKRIVFRVIGNKEVGMGHIYRSLALAHEITDHEIRFVCDDESRLAANKLAGYDYWLETYPKKEIEDRILDLKPNLVINDMLDTTRKYIQRLKKNNIKVVNFEDLGSGAQHADLAINELYDEPVIEGNNILWGHTFFFVRDEFQGALSHKHEDRVDNLLICFGGTDQNDLTRKVFKKIIPFCRKQGIQINIVSGEGYRHKKVLQKEIALAGYDNIEFTSATGVISSIMEKSQIAITSNGRTVYELAHMNIPSIVIAHHSREKTHLFASESKGFINLGLYEGKKTEARTLSELKRLVLDHEFRAGMFENIKPYRFTRNKRKVVKLIQGLLEDESK